MPCGSPQGVKLLSYLYNEAQNNCSNENYPVLLSLLKSSCEPYTRSVSMHPVQTGILKTAKYILYYFSDIAKWLINLSKSDTTILFCFSVPHLGLCLTGCTVACFVMFMESS